MQCDSQGWTDEALENALRSTSYLLIFVEDIPLCLIGYEINTFFIVAVKYNNIFGFPYFNDDMFRSFRPSLLFVIF